MKISIFSQPHFRNSSARAIRKVALYAFRCCAAAFAHGLALTQTRYASFLLTYYILCLILDYAQQYVV